MWLHRAAMVHVERKRAAATMRATGRGASAFRRHGESAVPARWRHTQARDATFRVVSGPPLCAKELLIRVMPQSAQPPLRCQIHMLRCGSSCAEARIRCTSKPTAHSKTRCPQLGASRDRITVNAAAPDNNFVGGQVAICVQSLVRVWRVFSVSSDAFFAAHAREHSCAP